MQPRVSLAAYSTMGLGGIADCLVEVTSREEVAEAVAWAKSKNVPSIMIGGGSNIIWGDQGFRGLVIVNKVPGYEVQQQGGKSLLYIGAGENWDSVVERSVAAGLTGIEALSLIPGTAGGTPVQNVGAYGQEIADSLLSVEAYDTTMDKFVTVAAADCAFGYRTSRFKTTDHGRFYITSLKLQLSKGNPQPPFYGAVEAYFAEHGVVKYTPAGLREAVIAIRSAKLPDPAKVHNTGSFFANPIIEAAQFAGIVKRFPDIANWPVSQDRVKLSAAWLIERAGFKDYHDAETGMATWPRQPLVLVNEKAKSTADLLAFKKKIVDAVQQTFGVTLVQEPELL